MSQVLLATRSHHKVHEIRRILDPVFAGDVLTLDDVGIPPADDEEGIEAFDTFRENALAKAAWFMDRSGLPTLADDSGIAVDALNGAPGVRSRRFAARPGLEGAALDDANNAALLERLAGLPREHRLARYTCVIAFRLPGSAREIDFVGTVSGHIAEEPRGTGGFGYDPLFFLPELGTTFADVPPDVKHAWSHRGRAFRALAASGSLTLLSTVR